MPETLQITPGERLTVLDGSPDVFLVEAVYAPGGNAPPAHHHPSQEEHFDMLQGTLRVEVAGIARDLHAGETLTIPAGTAHRMWNPFAQPARARWETRPAGRTEEWFRALAALQGTRHVDSDGTPNMLPFAALAHAYRDTFRLAARPDPAARAAVAALDVAARATGQSPPRPARRDLGALSGPATAIAFIGGLATALAIAESPYPRPGAQPRAIRRYFGKSAGAARISATGQLISAASLARFTSTVAGLASAADRPSRALRVLALASGGAAATSLAASAGLSFALTRGAGRRNADAVRLHRRLYLAGGPLHTAAFGGLVGCLSLAARRSGRLPRALSTAGLASATAAILSPLALLEEPLVLLIPAGRMTGLIVTAIAGARLSREPTSPAAARGAP
jgi:hypothetical protein